MMESHNKQGFFSLFFFFLFLFFLFSSGHSGGINAGTWDLPTWEEEITAVILSTVVYS